MILGIGVSMIEPRFKKVLLVLAKFSCHMADWTMHSAGVEKKWLKIGVGKCVIMLLQPILADTYSILIQSKTNVHF
jgi:hypothetical protein